MSECSIPDCGKPASSRGWCSVHYNRWLRHGDPLLGRTPDGEPARFYRDVVLAFDGDECLFWPYGKSPGGYGSIFVNGKNAIVSRLLCEHVNGPPPTPDHEAAHSCGKGGYGCVTKKHLRWATSKENKADMIEHGTHIRGERQWKAKLTEDDVREIRALHGHLSQEKIAARYGVCQTNVGKIIRRERWEYVI